MDVLVETKDGRLRGIATSDVVSFKGIPYAAAPVGRLRFRPPEPVEPWDGTRDAIRFGPIAPQNKLVGGLGELGFGSTPPEQGDDCLSLNIWSPGVGSDRLPVLFWIHGGGFTAGSGADPYCDGATFARDGVVCVTINYRLGAAGFLHTGEAGGGNFGLLDQIAALRWVQENVSSFGGDPALVTIAGESAGGGAVGALLAAPDASGLFRRAIVQSGGLDTYMTPDTALQMARAFAQKAGRDMSDLAGIQDLSSERILEAEQAVMTDSPLDASDVSGFLPVVGTDVVPVAPIQAVADRRASGVDVLIGHTAEEFRLFLALEPGLVGGAPTADGVSAMFSMIFPGQRAEPIYRSARPGASPEELLCAVMTDRLFRMPAIRLADAHASAGSDAGAKTYFYRLSWSSPALGGRMGAGHALDLPFVWDTLHDPWCVRLTGPNPPQHLATQMHAAWVSFAGTGNPGHAGLPAWPLYGPNERLVMEFGDRTAVRADPDGATRHLWERLTEPV